MELGNAADSPMRALVRSTARDWLNKACDPRKRQEHQSLIFP
jgi:hypothetical protein